MNGLKALLAKKRKAADEEFGGRKQVKRVDIEQARIKQLRTEERNELGVKVISSLYLGIGAKYYLLCKFCLARTQEARRALKRGADGSGELQRLDSSARTNSEEALPQEEVIRRLRLLGQPATLFGEVPPSTDTFDTVCSLTQSAAHSTLTQAVVMALTETHCANWQAVAVPPASTLQSQPLQQAHKLARFRRKSWKGHSACAKPSRSLK